MTNQSGYFKVRPVTIDIGTRYVLLVELYAWNSPLKIG